MERFDPHHEHAEAAALLRIEMLRQGRQPVGVEAPTAALMGRLAHEMTQQSPLSDVLVGVAEARMNRDGMKSSPTVSAVRTATVHHGRMRIENFSDKDWSKPENADRLVELINDDLENQATGIDVDSLGTFLFDLDYRNTPTAPGGKRYTWAEFFAQLLGESRFPYGIKALDVGPSIIVGAQQLMSKDKFPLRLEDVTVPSGGEEIDVTDVVRELLKRPSLFREIDCVDSEPVYWESRKEYDSTIGELAISAMRPISERGDPAFVQEIRDLMAIDKEASNISFMWADMLKASGRATFLERFRERYDMIIVNYVTQEMAWPDQRKLHHILCSLLRPPEEGGGVLAYIHPAHIHPVNVTQPAPIRNIRHYETHVGPHRHRLHLTDNLYAPKKLQEIMSFEDNRCQRSRVYGGEVMLDGRLQSIPDLLLRVR